MLMLKSTHEAAMAAKDAEIAALKEGNKLLVKEVARTGVLLTDERASHTAALTTIAEQQDEIERLAKDVQGLVPDAEAMRARRAKAMLNLKQNRRVPVEQEIAA